MKPGDRVRVRSGLLAGKVGRVVELDGGLDYDAVLAIPVALLLDGGLTNAIGLAIYYTFVSLTLGSPAGR